MTRSCGHGVVARGSTGWKDYDGMVFGEAPVSPVIYGEHGAMLSMHTWAAAKPHGKRAPVKKHKHSSHFVGECP